VVTSAAHSSGDTTPYEIGSVQVRPVVATGSDLERPWRGGGVVRRALAEERPDVVHVMHPMHFPHVFTEAQAAGIPLIAHVPDFFYPCARITMVQSGGALCSSPEAGERCITTCGIAPAPQRLAWARMSLDSASAVVCPCRATIDLHRQSGFDTSRWHHVPWGVDYTLHPARLEPPPPGPLRVGFLGTLLEHKGAHVAVDAVSSRPGLDVELRLYGGSFEQHEYEAALRDAAGSDPRILFVGGYEHPELPRILAGLDAVVIPSLWHENLPTVGLNAIASGLPLLVSDVGGLTELLDDYACGIAFRRGDAEDFAELLERLAGDSSILTGIRSRMAAPPSVEEEASQIEALYELASRPRSAREPRIPEAPHR
jgi:glycosyltransferase involved in cell wall biosynthesis